MPQTQLSNRLGTNNTIFDVDEKPRVPRSRFDLSRKLMTTIDLGGIYPVDFFRTFPGDEFDLSIRYLLDTLPLAVPPMNNYRVRTHWFFCKMSSLWKGWESFVTKGRSGTIEMQVPTVSGDQLDASRDGKYQTVPMGLPSFLGIQPKFTSDQSSASDAIFLPYCKNGVKAINNVNRLQQGYNALPFLMYQKIYRDNYAPVNLLTDNHIWFPDDLADEWRFDYDATNVGSVGEQKGLFFIPKGDISAVASVKANNVPAVDDTVVDLLSLRYACYENDYFTSAKPWLVRGGKETLLQSDAGLDFSDVILKEGVVVGKAQFDLNTSSLDPSSFNPNGLYADSPFELPKRADITKTGSFPNSDSHSLSNFQSNNESFKPAFGVVVRDPNWPPTGIYSHYTSIVDLVSTAPSWKQTAFLNLLQSGKAQLAITANSLRNLLALSVWQERNAVANGNYNALIRAHFNASPHSPEYEPVYLGGTSDIVSFGQVIQTSQGTSDSPLGTQGGFGSANGQGHVFHFSSRDYGYIMGLMFITPEVIYKQGVDRIWTDIHQSEIFYPEFANLGYEPILNRELFVTGNDSVDEGLAGYQTRCAYLKQRQNKATGLFGLPQGTDKLFSAYVQGREFDELPKLSAEFVSLSPENVRRDFLSFTKQPAFKLQFASDLSVVRALPFQSTPNTFGF